MDGRGTHYLSIEIYISKQNLAGILSDFAEELANLLGTARLSRTQGKELIENTTPTPAPLTAKPLPPKAYTQVLSTITQVADDDVSISTATPIHHHGLFFQ